MSSIASFPVPKTHTNAQLALPVDIYCIALCPDINECLTARDDCSPDASCSNTYGSHVCTCNSGYTGNGTSCQGNHIICRGTVLLFSVRACATCRRACHACRDTLATVVCLCVCVCVCVLHRCKKTNKKKQNSFMMISPTCPTHYYCVTIVLLDVDECQTGNHGCSVNGSCENRIGTFSCRCNLGYAGNGITCSGKCRYIPLTMPVILADGWNFLFKAGSIGFLRITNTHPSTTWMRRNEMIRDASHDRSIEIWMRESYNPFDL